MKRFAFLVALFVQFNPLFCQDNLSALYLKLQLGESKAVIDTLSVVVKDTSYKNHNVLLLLGDAYKFQYDYTTALKCYNRILKQNETNKRALESASDLYSLVGEPQKSIQSLEKLYCLDSSNNRIAFKLALALFSNSNINSALNICRKIYLLDSGNYNIAKTLGDCYWAIGKNDSSRFFYSRADRINRKSTYTKLMISRILFDDLDYNTAKIFASRGVDLDSSSVQLRKQLANCCFKLYDYSEALPQYLYLFEQGDSSDNNLKKIGACMFFLKNYEMCIPWFEKSLKNDEQNSETLFYLGSALNEMGKYSDALKYLSLAYSAIQPEPEVVYIIKNQSGLVLGNMKKFEEAYNAFKEASLNKPEDINLLYQMGMMKGQQSGNKNLSLAQDLLNKYLIALESKNVALSKEDIKMKSDAETYLERIKEELFINSK